MKRRILLISLVILIGVGYLEANIVAAIDDWMAPDHSFQVPQPAVSFSNSSRTSAGVRRQMELRILSSTVRYLIQSWVVKPGDAGYVVHDSVGHGTVMDGQYLVTHNHIEIPLSVRAREGDPEAYSKIELFNDRGERLYEGPLSGFEIVSEETETLVLGAKEEGFFTRLGLASADFAASSSLGLQPDMEVAQVDWDGSTTRVDWTVVQEVVRDGATPRLILAGGTKVGASGGGVFWQGIHVANNWRLEERVDGTGNVVAAVTTAALNIAEILN